MELRQSAVVSSEAFGATVPPKMRLGSCDPPSSIQKPALTWAVVSTSCLSLSRWPMCQHPPPNCSPGLGRQLKELLPLGGGACVQGAPPVDSASGVLPPHSPRTSLARLDLGQASPCLKGVCVGRFSDSEAFTGAAFMRRAGRASLWVSVCVRLVCVRCVHVYVAGGWGPKPSCRPIRPLLPAQPRLAGASPEEVHAAPVPSACWLGRGVPRSGSVPGRLRADRWADAGGALTARGLSGLMGTGAQCGVHMMCADEWRCGRPGTVRRPCGEPSSWTTGAGCVACMCCS